MPAIIQSDHFEVALVHSDSGLGGKSRQMVDLNGSYRTKTYDMKGMGANAQVNDLGLMTVIANTQSLVLSGEPIEIDNMVDNDMARRLDVELLRAFGVEVATMGGFIQEVMAGLGENSQLSVEQKAQLQELITEIITLKKLTSLGVLPQGVERLQKLVAETADKIADLLKDGLDNRILSGAIAEFSHHMLDKTAKEYGLTELSEKLAVIEGRMNPQNYLTQSVAELISQLTAILENSDIEEATKEDIGKILDDLATQAEGEPLSREILKQLDGLIEKLPEKHAMIIQKTVETVRDANIVLKAAISGLSVAQMLQVEGVINDLETIKGNLENSKEPLTADQEKLASQLEKTIKALDHNPVDIKAIQEVTKLQSRLSMSASLVGGISGILAKLSPILTMQETALAKRRDINVEKKVREIDPQVDVTGKTPFRPIIADTVKAAVAVVSFSAKSEGGADPLQQGKENTKQEDKKTSEPSRSKGEISDPPPSDNEKRGNIDKREQVQPLQTPSEEGKDLPPGAPDTDVVPVKPDEKIIPEGKAPCGDNCQCKTDFNEVASHDLTPQEVVQLNTQLQEEFGGKYVINNDKTVTVLDDQGKIETVTIEEMIKRVEVDRIIEETSNEVWDKFLKQAGGGRDKAVEDYRQNAKIENEEIRKVDPRTTTQTDSKKLDDSIRKKLEELKAAEKERKDKPEGERMKHIFCKCCEPGADGQPTPPVKREMNKRTAAVTPGDDQPAGRGNFKGRVRPRKPS